MTGGVSSWLQWIMKNMVEFSFSVVALIGEPKAEKDRKYPIPDNVVSYQEHVIFDYTEIENAVPLKLSATEWRKLSGPLYRLMQDWRGDGLSPESIVFLKELLRTQSPGIFRNFLDDEAAFSLLTRIYEEFRWDAGFVNYFYNYRNIHFVLFRLISLVSELPVSAIYHASPSGYSGLLACLRASIYGAVSMVTEHVSYVQEREIDMLKSEWLKDQDLKDMWLDMFSSTCRWEYRACDRLITLSEGAKNLLTEDYGAKEENLEVIPNGVDIERFKKARRTRCTTHPRIAGFVGRVDSIKDLKTFIQAIAIIRKNYPEVQGVIVGPRYDQPRYYKECTSLIHMLDLKDTIIFTGRADVVTYYQKMDVLLLTSIKEGMPLVVLEALAGGLPVVATDVGTGSCRELLYGGLSSQKNDGLGQAGVVVGIKNAEAIANATVKLLRDADMANTFARNGIRRVEKFYRESLIINRYREIYQEELGRRGR